MDINKIKEKMKTNMYLRDHILEYVVKDLKCAKKKQ